MDPTSEPENRQSRGLGRFWPVHGTPTPAQRQSEEDLDAHRAAAATHASDQQAGAAGPTGEHPQVSDQQSQPHDDQQGSDEQSPNPFAPRPHPALTSDTQMVALGSRRPADALLSGSNGARWNPGGFPPVETNGHRNGEAGPRHGGGPVANGQPPVGSVTLPGARSPFAPGGDDAVGDEPARSAFIPTGDELSARPAFPPATDDSAPGARSSFAPTDHGPPGARSPFAPTDHDPPGPRSPFAPADDGAPAGPLYAPSPFALPASGSAAVTGAHPAVPGGPAPTPQPVARPVSAAPSAAGSAQVPVPMGGRPVSSPPVSAPATPAPSADPVAPTRSEPARADASRLEPTRLEPTGWATAGPRPGATGSATVPVSAPGNGRRSRDDEATDEQAVPAPRRGGDTPEAAPGHGSAHAAGESPKRPGDVNDISITFWPEAASEQFRAEWHEVKAQFVDDPEAALTRAHDLLTEAVHELTESMLAERDELDPLRGAAKPDTESMRMAMRGYREFMDRILAL